MTTEAKKTVRFLLGVVCVLAAIVGAFYRLAWFYFAFLFAGGCGMMGQRTVWEKVLAIARGNYKAPK